MRAALILPVALVSLLGGGASDSDNEQTEQELWADPGRVAAELDRRLRSLLAYHEGILVFVDPDPRLPTVYGLPAATSWLVACDLAGLSVGVGAGSEEAGTGIDLQITAAPLSEPRCRALVPIAATILAAIAQGK